MQLNFLQSHPVNVPSNNSTKLQVLTKARTVVIYVLSQSSDFNLIELLERSGATPEKS
jgi:hypothetical protein